MYWTGIIGGAIVAALVIAVTPPFLLRRRPTARDAYGRPLRPISRGLRPKWVDLEGNPTERVVLRSAMNWVCLPVLVIVAIIVVDFVVSPSWYDLLWLAVTAIPALAMLRQWLISPTEYLRPEQEVPPLP
jgi:hypothetical protein